MTRRKPAHGHKLRWMRPKKTRRFGGKQYRRLGHWDYKQNAHKSAKRERKKGYLVRVVPTRDYQLGKKWYGWKWAVYIRKRRR